MIFFLLFSFLQFLSGLMVFVVDGEDLPFLFYRCILAPLGLLPFLFLCDSFWRLVPSGLFRRLAVTATRLVLATFFFYRIMRLESLDFLLFSKYGSEMFRWESLLLIWENTGPVVLTVVVCLLFAALWMEFQNGLLSALPAGRTRLQSWLLFLFLSLPSFFLPWAATHEPAVFLRSAFSTGNVDFLLGENFNDSRGLYPLVQEPQNSRSDLSESERPHVFVVMLESFSAFYSDGHKENGKAVTPFLDSLREQGLFVSQFYGNSVETSKGQAAALCSLVPAHSSNIFTNYYDNNYRCLPSILQDEGYETVFMKAYHDLSFENTGVFAKHNGFRHARGMDKSFVSPAEKKKWKWGWGVQDDFFYRKVFSFLDSLHKEDDISERPFFVSLMSVSNHMMFSSVPDDQKYIYPDADDNNRQNFSNTMHLTDSYLREFFRQLEKRDWLQNSIVAVFGDNGYPMGQHRRNYINTKTYNEELFRTPLWILWPGKLSPKKIENRAYSQIDVAPTLMGLLGLKARNHFAGIDILDDSSTTTYLPLVQPFDGTWIASVRWPWKLVHRLRNNNEALYNLKRDPKERRNRLDSPSDAPLEQLRSDLRETLFREQLLREDRIWPTAGMASVARIRMKNTRFSMEEGLNFELVSDSADSLSLLFRSAIPGDSIFMEQRVSILAGSGKIPHKLLRPGINILEIHIDSDTGADYVFRRDVFMDDGSQKLLSDMDVKGKQGWGKLHKNRSVRRNRLVVGGIGYGFGLGSHANSSHKVLLKKKFLRFRTLAGIDDEARCGNGVRFEIWADGHLLKKSGHLNNDEIWKADLDVSGVDELELKSMDEGNRKCDHVDWLNTVLIR